MQTQRAFSMLELITVVAIIAILAALSIPAYLQHVTATKISSLWQLAEPAKLYVESQYLKNNINVNALVVNSGTTDFTSADSSLVKCITIQNGVISVVGNPDSFFGNTYWVAWSPSVSSGRITWSCSYPAAAQQYMATSVTNCTPGSPQFASDAACN
jgi:prepilin-type N-terminal cleavage/methylation domain-containing protein